MADEEISTRVQIRIIDSYIVERGSLYTWLPRTNENNSSLMLDYGYLFIFFAICFYFLLKKNKKK